MKIRSIYRIAPKGFKHHKTDMKRGVYIYKKDEASR